MGRGWAAGKCSRQQKPFPRPVPALFGRPGPLTAENPGEFCGCRTAQPAVSSFRFPPKQPWFWAKLGPETFRWPPVPLWMFAAGSEDNGGPLSALQPPHGGPKRAFLIMIRVAKVCFLPEALGLRSGLVESPGPHPLHRKKPDCSQQAQPAGGMG